MVDAAFVDRWVRRLRAEVPEAVAVVLGGSVVRGDAGPYSDVDLDVVVPEGPREEWPSWYDEHDGRPVRVSTWVRDVRTWEAARREPQGWAFGLACAEPLELRWVADSGWRDRLAGVPATYPPGPPELDHFEGEVGKVANAWRRGDDLAVRLAAGDLARSVVSLLVPANPRPPVTGREQALRTVLAFDVAPAGYGGDLRACLGLADRHVRTGEVYAACVRLAHGTVAVLGERVDAYAALLSADELAHVTGGELRDWVRCALGPAVTAPP